MSSRQTPRAVWTLDHLNYEQSILLGLSIDSTTAATYSSTTNSYLTFCKKHQLSIEPMAETLSYYITYQTHFISPDSVDSYLSRIVNQLKPYYPDVCKQQGSLLVKQTLKGAQRMCSKGVCHKKPLLIWDLESVQAQLAGSTLFNDLLFEAQLNTGFGVSFGWVNWSKMINLPYKTGKKLLWGTHSSSYPMLTCFYFLTTKVTWCLRETVSYAEGSQVFLTHYVPCANTLMHGIVSTLSTPNSGCEVTACLPFAHGGSPSSDAFYY